MNSDYIKACVISYLRYTRQYPLVCFERGIMMWGPNKPDILAVNKQRKLIEIEVKISIADFKNDIKKRVWTHRENEKEFKRNSNEHQEYFDKLYGMPYQFYYAIPETLKDKAVDLIKKWKQENKTYGNTGLMVVRFYPNGIRWNDNVYVRINAPINKKSPKLNIKDIITMTKNQSGTICSLITKICKMSNAPNAPNALLEQENSLLMSQNEKLKDSEEGIKI